MDQHDKVQSDQAKEHHPTPQAVRLVPGHTRMPDVQGRSGYSSCPDCWFSCTGRSGQPGASQRKPEAPKEFSCAISSPTFSDTKGFRSDAFLELICVNI